MSNQSLQYKVTLATALLLGAEHCRLINFEQDELPAINVVPDEERTEIEDDTDEENIFRFHVRFICLGVNDARAQADALFVNADKLLAASRTLGGLVRSVRRVGRSWQMEQEALEQIAHVATYECTYSTRRTDASVAGY